MGDLWGTYLFGDKEGGGMEDLKKTLCISWVILKITEAINNEKSSMRYYHNKKIATVKN